MAGYAVLAVGLINLRYQGGNTGNALKSLILIIPGVLLLLSSFISQGKVWLQSKRVTWVIIVTGMFLLIYSFLL